MASSERYYQWSSAFRAGSEARSEGSYYVLLISFTFRQAPEVFIGDYGVEADVWAGGMMMYQLLSNRFPWWSTMEELHTTTLEEVSSASISG